MKKTVAIILIQIVYAGICVAQQDTNKTRKPFRQDQWLIDFYHDNWLNKSDSIKTKWKSHGISVSAMYDHPVKNTNFNFAAGIGFASHNVRNDGQIARQGDTISLVIPIGDSFQYKRNKLSTNYIDVPVEVRFRTKPGKKGYSIKFSLGARAGYLVNVHTATIISGKYFNKDKYKDYKIPDIARYRYGVHFRAGYGKAAVFGFYSLSTLFAKNKGPDIIPFSAGISVMPF